MMYRTLPPLLLILGLGLAACGSQSADNGSDTAAGGSDTTGDGEQSGDTDGNDEPLGAGEGAIGTIEITITHPDADPLTYTIGCLGDAFPVTPEVEGVSGREACLRLDDEAVLERLVNGPPADQVCTEIYGGPDEATIVGELNGMEIDTVIDRTNGCGIAVWDDLLDGVLPPARGVS